MPGFRDAVIEFKGEALAWGDVMARLRASDERGAKEFWYQGDLILAVAPMGTGSGNNGTEETVRAAAAEAGLEYETLDIYRKVAAGVPPGVRVPGVSWSAYREVVFSGKSPAEQRALFARFRSVRAPNDSGRWTVNAVRLLIGRKPAPRQGRLKDRVGDATPEERVEAAPAVLTDPAVIAAAARPGTPVAQAMETFTDQVIKRAEEAAQAPPTESVKTFTERVKEAKDNSPAYQYDRLMVAVTAFMAAYEPEAVADDIVHSPHTTRVAHYTNGAERVLAYWTALSRGLKEQARPRLVPVGGAS